MTSLEPVTVDAQTVQVLGAPMSLEQYRTERDADGNVTAVVSADFEEVLGQDYDTNLDYVAALVMAHLGEAWSIHDMTVIGADPRPRPDMHSGQRILLRVRLWPGPEATLGADDQLWDGVDTHDAFADLAAGSRAALEGHVRALLVPLRRLGHAPQVASPVTVIDSELEVVLLCTRCDGSTQALFDTATGALADVADEGGHDSDDRCPGA